MALEITITKADALTRDVQVETPVEDVEAAEKAKAEAEAAVQKITHTVHAGWNVAASVKGSWGTASSTFFIDDLPETATEKDFVDWVKAKYAE